MIIRLMIELIHISKNPEDLAKLFAERLLLWIDEHTQSIYHIALSGGKTPSLLFKLLAENYQTLIPWQKVHFWWGDERMVPSYDPESNYGVANELLLSKIPVPPHNVHRIKGEADPIEEAKRYSTEIRSMLPMRNQWPVFDVIVLGLGDDGHTASIFPKQEHLFDSDQFTELSMNPVTSQIRITLTGKVFNNAWKVAFLVTGKTKAMVLSKIIHHHKGAEIYPAAHIHPKGELHWFIDEACMPVKPVDY
jgi:6-phosphogluconolactonase